MTKLQKWIIWSSLSALLFISATGNIRWTQLASGDRHGTAAKGQASDGTGASGNCAKFAADGSVTDAGGACGVAGGAAGGDLSGTYPNPTVAKVNTLAIPASAPCVGTNSSSQFITASCGGSSSNPVPTLTWDNQSGATVSDINGTEQLCSGTALSGINARYSTAAVPATPYNFTVQMVINPTGEGNNHQFATNLLFRESSTGKYVGVGLNVNASGGTFLTIDNWTSAAVYSSSPYSNTSIGWNPILTWTTPSFIYVRARDDGANISFYYSLDGNNFFQIGSNLSRTAFMAGGPNQLAFAVSQTTAGASVCNTLLQWVTP